MIYMVISRSSNKLNLMFMNSLSKFLVAAFLYSMLSSCLNSQIHKSVSLASGYIALDDKNNSGGDSIKWKPVQKMENAIDISLNATRDTIVIHYITQTATFIKEKITESEEKTIRKKIKDFTFIGSFRRNGGDGLYNHFYLSDAMDLMIQVKDKPGHLLFNTIHLQTGINPLDNVTDLNTYLNIEEGKKYNGPIQLKN